MKIPLATYRLQFNTQFTFLDAEKIVEYFKKLGISDIYASPVFKSKNGSIHGYDVVDPLQINGQLGGQEAFNQLIVKAQEQHLGWMQDIVPNHMAFDSENRLLMDIFENGSRSKYYSFFDVQWDHPYDHLKGKLLAPFLGDLYGRCLDRNEIKLRFDENGFGVCFYEWKFPLKIGSYSKVLGADLNWLGDKIQREDKDYIDFLEITHSFKNLEESTNASDYYNQLALLKARLWKLYLSNGIIKGYVDFLITVYNGIPGDSHSLNKLDELLSEQHYKLSFWKVGNEELNYRRFFTINGLLSLHIEDQQVFDHTHQLIFQLIKSGHITGLRIDHVDGLYDPVTYLNKIRQRVPEIYITIEKILDIHEHLPSIMPVQGTTGYDFMNVVNEVFIDKASEKMIDRFYVSFTGQTSSYRNFVSDKKKLFMGQHMAGDIDNLALLLKQIISGDRYGRDMTMYALRRAIVEIMAQFPVYRAYMGEGGYNEEDKIHIKEAIALAENKNPGLINELDFISKILLLEIPADMSGSKKEDYYRFTKKFQQFSGALMAKGAEDTTFYIYNRFISLNEVGGDPSVFGISLKEFHELMMERQKNWPFTMNASSTHDTKRGEDIRARLNVLSEIPRQWLQKVTLWSRLTRNRKKMIQGLQAPDRNDEFFIYQTLIGAYPFEDDQREPFIGRMKEYVIKSLRESKRHTNWIKQDVHYEEACTHFIDEILKQDDKNEFLNSFLVFQKQIASDGIINSLAQTMLKMTTPGIPDFYQGCELWDLSLVDPDNRRPVDFQQRMNFLEEINNKNGLDFIKALKENPTDGKIKLFLVSKVLEIRQKYPDLFLRGEYLPLEIAGEMSKYVIAFGRRAGPLWAIIIVPRFQRQFSQEQHEWKDIFLSLPEDAPSEWSNVLTQQNLSVKKSLSLKAVFHDFPVTLLVSSSH